MKLRSVARVVEACRWESDAVLRFKGIPGDVVPSGTEAVDAAIEESHAPHLNGDTEAREKAEADIPMEGNTS